MINKDLTEKNEFLTDEEKKYANICANLMYFYLKKSNGIIDVKEVLNNLSGDKGENKKRLERIIGHLNKVILFDKVSLTYSDYLKLDKIVKNQKNYEMKIIPYIVSCMALVIAIISILALEESIKCLLMAISAVIFSVIILKILK